MLAPLHAAGATSVSATRAHLVLDFNEHIFTKFSNFCFFLACFSQQTINYLLKFKIFLDKPHLDKLALACKII